MSAFDFTLTFALERDTRALRHVREVKTGQACACICPGCEEPLEAVNAQAATYKMRPHFRHLEGQNSAECAARSIAKAAEAALEDVLSVQLPPITPQPRTLFDDKPPEVAATEIERFELVDHTEGLLHLPDGRKLRVRVIARATGGKNLESDFDLILDLSNEDLESCKSLDNLRKYLTLDSSCWRWCQRQIKPTLLPEKPAEDKTAKLAIPAPDPVLEQLMSQRVQVVGAPAPSTQVDASPAPAVEYVKEWTDPPVKFPDGTVLLFHRKLTASGIMRETVERLSPEDAKRLI